MTERPHVLLSVAMSVDGYIDDAGAQRLLLSNAADFDRVDEARARCDAIMIGAETIRRDDPRLLVNSEARRAERVARGLPEYPLKVTVTAAGDLSRDAKFFTTGGDKVVYCLSATEADQRAELHGSEDVDVVDAGHVLDPRRVLDDLAARGVRRLMIEGGSSLHTLFLTADLVDEIHLAIAPFFVGDPKAPRFVGPGDFPQNPERRMTLAETRRIGDMVFARYLIGSPAAPQPPDGA